MAKVTPANPKNGAYNGQPSVIADIMILARKK